MVFVCGGCGGREGKERESERRDHDNVSTVAEPFDRSGEAKPRLSHNDFVDLKTPLVRVFFGDVFFCVSKHCMAEGALSSGTQ